MTKKLTILLLLLIFGITIAYAGQIDFGASIRIPNSDGLDIDPGSDTDIDIITLGVSGTPRAWWDETNNIFRLTKGLHLSGSVTTTDTLFASRGIFHSSASTTDFTVINLKSTNVTTTLIYASGRVSTTNAYIENINVDEGTNKTMGVATLVGGSVSVTTTPVTASSRIFLTIQSPSGTVGNPYIVQRTAGVGFHVSSTSATDASSVGWLLIEPY